MNTNSASANQYAQAIIEAMLERWQGALSVVATALQQNSQLAATLDDPNRDINERLSTLDSVVPTDAPVELRNTLKLMVQDGQAHLIAQLGEALSQVSSGASAPTKAEVTSAVVLSEAEQEQLRRSLQERYGSNLTFAFYVDPSLMGGLRVRVGDRLIDTSVATRLQAMRETLSSAVR